MVWLIVRLLLAAMFAVAAVAKVLAPASTATALRSFHVPRWAVRPGVVMLPAFELALATALVPPTTAGVASWAATGLLVGFVAVVAAALARGERPTCNCFGALGERAIGVPTLARNTALTAGAAALAVLGPGESLGRALNPVSSGAVIAVSALVVVLIGLIVFSWQLMRQNGRLLARVEAVEAALASVDGVSAPIEDAPGGLPIGTPAPSFSLTDEHGEPRTLEQLLAPGAPIVLAFSDPGCPGCRLIAPVIEDTRRRGIPVHLVTRADAPHAPGALHQLDREVMRDYRAHMVPSAVRIDPDGRIASELAVGEEAIEALLAEPAPSVLTTHGT